jgi:signal transduction histidine kinase
MEEMGPLEVSPAVQDNGRASAVVLREAMAVARDGRMASFEWLHRGAHGANIPCEVRLSRLPDSSGRNLVIATIIDISARKQAEKRLLQTLEHERELNELKTNFVSMVSHEFRTPLGIISSSAEILSRYFERLDADGRREHLNTIVRSTRVLGTMMEEVLLLGRFESGRMQFTPKPVDLAAIARTLADEIVSATDSACPIEVRVNHDLAGARSDEFLLRHIFSNLLSNAVKYSPAGSPVELTISREHHDAVWRVRDHGIGVDPDDLRLLFQAFRRGRNVGSRPGSGLGLVIVQRCVQLHGGDIAIESKPGQGTIVTVRLKVFAPPAPA